jgi:GT2 family glycosyltransferase
LCIYHAAGNIAVTRASIIVVSWNGEAYIGDCLDAITAQAETDDEIVVVDNASVDGTVALVHKHYPRVRLIENERNLGFAGGCNAGLRVAKGERFFILNQDVVLHKGWLDTMYQALSDPLVGVVGCKLFYPDGRTVQHAGGIIHWPRATPDHWGHGEEDDGNWDKPKDVDYVTGAAWGFRRDTPEQIGELDAGFWPGYYEEVDYCFRAREVGLRVVYVPAAEAIHAESTSLGKGSEAYLRAFQQGRLRFVLKHLPTEKFLCDFVPAERAWLTGESTWRERLIMERVYRKAILMVPTIYAAQGEYSQSTFDMLLKVTAALVDLGSPKRRSELPVETEEEGFEQRIDG